MKVVAPVVKTRPTRFATGKHKILMESALAKVLALALLVDAHPSPSPQAQAVLASAGTVAANTASGVVETAADAVTLTDPLMKAKVALSAANQRAAFSNKVSPPCANASHPAQLDAAQAYKRGMQLVHQVERRARAFALKNVAATRSSTESQTAMMEARSHCLYT
jgi:hypothetical protein